MPSKNRDSGQRDVGREIDSQEPSPELKRAVARDIDENAGKRPIPASQADEFEDGDADPEADEEQPES